MSGKKSRAERVAVVKAAKARVYYTNAQPYRDANNPYPLDSRAHRIFKKYYEHWCLQYYKLEDIVKEMREVYGG